MFSYQCSQLSTPQSVIEVFNTAKRFQKNQDTTKYVSVVVLDEVGLAEDSPNLPLKALHPLLEDGTEGADHNAEVNRTPRISKKDIIEVPNQFCYIPMHIHVGCGKRKASGFHWYL